MDASAPSFVRIEPLDGDADLDGVLDVPLEPPLAGIIGRLARREVDAGRRPGPADIQPLYVRRPDAELARDARVER